VTFRRRESVEHMSTLSVSDPQASNRRPDWLTRNWKWLATLGCFALLLLLATFVGTIFLVVEVSFQHNGAYKQGLELAKSNRVVAQKMGQPVKAGWLATGNISVSGSLGKAEISIPIAGPKGKGTLYVVANKSADQWHLETLQVAVDGESQRIDLLQPGDLPVLK
jgi:Cytochrome oxidase complex assembly protein 1